MLEASSAESGFEISGTVDIKHSVIEVVFRQEFGGEFLSDRNCIRWKQSDVKVSGGFRIDGSV